MLRRAGAALLAVGCAALVAVGCGGDSGGDAGTSGLAGDEGPLAWLPADTWMVVSVNLAADDIDTAIETLDRLPAWTLAESFLPAEDGAGLRRELFDAFVESGGYDTSVTGKRLAAAFGDRAGIAITSTDLEGFDEDTGPVTAWFEVKDEDRAVGVARDLIDAKTTKREHGGVTYWEAAKEDVAYAVEDDLLVLTTSGKAMQQAIDLRDGDKSLADDETGRAVIEAGIGDAFFGSAVQTDPLLEAIPGWVELAAEDTEDPKDAALARSIAEDLGPVLESAAVDGLVADWMANAVTIDEVGLRFYGAWSNPRELADPKVGSRELLERMPADAAIASSMVSDGSSLGRLQDAWVEVRDAYDLDLRSYAAECDADVRSLCELGLIAALELLEDEELADAMADRGDQATAYVQDIAASLAEPGKAPTSRTMEIATTAEPMRWEPSSDLAGAMRTAGVSYTLLEDGSYRIRILPGSPLAAMLREFQRGAAAAQPGADFGLRQLVSPQGITVRAEEVDGLRVSGFPLDATSTLIPALEGDADTLGDSETFRKVTKAAKVPETVGAYGWIDVRSFTTAVLDLVAATDPEVKRVIPTVENNLADAPAMVWWSSREEVDGEQVGTWELAWPVLE